MGTRGKSKRALRGLAQERIKELQGKYGLGDPLEVLFLVAHGVEPDRESGDLNAVRPILAGIDSEGKPILGASPELRVQAAIKLASLAYPRRKAVPFSGSEGNPIKFIVAPDLSSVPFETCIHCGRPQKSQEKAKASEKAATSEFRV
jgi:hypothetical protein